MPFPPTPSNTPSNTPTPSITASQTPTYTPTGTLCPGATPSNTPSVSITASNTPTPTITASQTPTVSITASQTPTVSITATNTATPTSTIGLTPTQTQTMTQTPTSTYECLCFSSATVNVTEAGNITFNDCNGNPTIENFGVGNNQTYGDGTFCIQKDTNGGTAMYTIVRYNGLCCITPTVTPTPTHTTTPTSTPPVVCNTNWLVRNADCGFGTVNDIGINGSFMGTLSGPSTFPLTSTLYGTKSSPNGVICGTGNTIQANVTTNLPGTGNCAFMEIIINSVQQHILYFTSNPFPQISGVTIANGDTVEVRIGCFLGPCPP